MFNLDSFIKKHKNVIMVLSSLFTIGLIVLIILLGKNPDDTPPSKYPTLKVYRIETAGEGDISGGNSADLEGQLSYGAMYLPNRYNTWPDRVIREYELQYIPFNEACDIPKGTLPDGTDFKLQYLCPPYAKYAKCNPAGCATNTICKKDSECPGQGGKCLSGVCICCKQDNECSTNDDCAAGTCGPNKKCDCSKFNMEYSCNVGMYPTGTTNPGNLKYIGSVLAPVDKSSYEHSDWIPKGIWYSTPRAGECTGNKQLGDNCYWKLVSKNKVFTLKEIANKGFKFYCKDTSNPLCFKKRDVAAHQTENLKILQQAFGIDTSPTSKTGLQDIRHAVDRPSWQQAGIDPDSIF